MESVGIGSSIAAVSPETLKLAGIGTAAGAFSGLFGVGGGTIIVPLLILFCGYGERLATGTSLAAIVLIGALGALAQGGIYGNVDARHRALAGDAGRRRRPRRDGVPAADPPARGLAAVRGPADRRGDRAGRLVSELLAALLAVAGGLAGGLVGVGGGILFVPAMTIFLDLGQVRAESTSLLMIVIVALVGAYRQHGYGNVRLRDAVDDRRPLAARRPGRRRRRQHGLRAGAEARLRRPGAVLRRPARPGGHCGRRRPGER